MKVLHGYDGPDGLGQTFGGQDRAATERHLRDVCGVAPADLAANLDNQTWREQKLAECDSRQRAATSPGSEQAYMTHMAAKLIQCGVPQNEIPAILKDTSWRQAKLTECEQQQQARLGAARRRNTAFMVVGGVAAVGLAAFVAYRLLSR